MVDQGSFGRFPMKTLGLGHQRSLATGLLAIFLLVSPYGALLRAQTPSPAPATAEIAPSPTNLDDTDYFAVFDAASYAVRRSALGNMRVNVNGAYDPKRLNIYLLKPSAIDGVRSQACNCRTVAGQNVVYCDQALIKATVSSFDFSNAQSTVAIGSDPELVQAMARMQDDNAAIILTWIIGHEVGHIAFAERRHGASTMPNGSAWTRRGEEEWADQFALGGITGAERSASALFFSNLGARLSESLGRPPGKVHFFSAPGDHPPADYRALLFAYEASKNRITPSGDPELRARLANYVGDATERLATNCSIVKALKTENAADDQRRADEDLSLAFAGEITRTLIERQHSLAPVALLEPSAGNVGNLSAELSWMQLWLLSINLDRLPLGGRSDLMKKIVATFGPTANYDYELIPVYVRLARLRAFDPSFANSPELEPLFGKKNPAELRDYFAKVADGLLSLLPDRTKGQFALAQRASVLELIALLDPNALGETAPPPNVVGAYSHLVHWALEDNGRDPRINFLTGAPVSLHGLREVIPSAFRFAVAQQARYTLVSWFENSSDPARFDILGEFTLSAMLPGAEENVDGLLGAGTKACAAQPAAGCLSPTWLNAQVQSSLWLGRYHEAVLIASRNKGAFWAAARTNPELVNALQSFDFEAADLATIVTLLRGDAKPLPARTEMRRRCAIAQSLVGLGRYTDLQGDEAACVRLTVALSDAKCEPVKAVAGDATQVSDCYDMRMLQVQLSYAFNDFTNAAVALGKADALYAEFNPDYSTNDGFAVRIGGKKISAAALRDAVARGAPAQLR